MEILNTVEAHGSLGAIITGIIFTVLAIGLFILFVLLARDGEIVSTINVILLLVLVAFLAQDAFTREIPERMEIVITDPDFVIDAAKYEIIEQRGEIYVIQERKVSAN